VHILTCFRIHTSLAILEQ